MDGKLPVRGWLLAALVVAATLSLASSLTTDAQPERTGNVEVRVWQRISDPADIAISARPVGGRWGDFGTHVLDLKPLRGSTTYLVDDIRTGGLQIWIWQRRSNLERLSISARPLGASWDDYVTVPLHLERGSDSRSWRYADITLPMPKPDEVVEVSSVHTHTCALWRSGKLACWGENEFGETDVWPGTFRSVGVGSGITCAVLDSGALACWGRDLLDGLKSPPTGEYRSVAVGWRHACAVHASGEVDCWGRNDDGQADPPGGTFRSVSAGIRHTCGLRDSGRIEC